MRKRKLITGLCLGLLGTTACGSGVAGTVSLDDPYDPHPASGDKAPASPISQAHPASPAAEPHPASPVGNDPKPPSPSGQNPGKWGGSKGGTSTGGSSSSGGGGGSSNCLECTTYSCTQTEGGKTQTTDVKLKSGANGACTIDDVSIECGGKITQKGQTIGSWSANGSTWTGSASGTSLSCTKK